MSSFGHSSFAHRIHNISGGITLYQIHDELVANSIDAKADAYVLTVLSDT